MTHKTKDSFEFREQRAPAAKELVPTDGYRSSPSLPSLWDFSIFLSHHSFTSTPHVNSNLIPHSISSFADPILSSALILVACIALLFTSALAPSSQTQFYFTTNSYPDFFFSSLPSNNPSFHHPASCRFMGRGRRDSPR